MEKRIARLQQLERRCRARSPPSGLPRRGPWRPAQAQDRRARPAVRDDDGEHHDRHRTRPQAPRRAPGSSSSRSEPPTSSRSSRTPRSCSPARRPDTGTKIKTHDDEYGYRWLILRGPGLRRPRGRDQHGLEPARRAAATATACWPPCSPSRRTASRSTSSTTSSAAPTTRSCPRRATQARDTERELRLQAQLGAELPWEADMARWFPLWDIPL